MCPVPLLCFSAHTSCENESTLHIQRYTVAFNIEIADCRCDAYLFQFVGDCDSIESIVHIPHIFLNQIVSTSRLTRTLLLLLNHGSLLIESNLHVHSMYFFQFAFRYIDVYTQHIFMLSVQIHGFINSFFERLCCSGDKLFLALFRATSSLLRSLIVHATFLLCIFHTHITILIE